MKTTKYLRTYRRNMLFFIIMLFLSGATAIPILPAHLFFRLHLLQ